MRILSITAGAAGMYCGSCFRDNALAAELMARGHDVTLVPVYTPTRTDEANVSRRDVLFGGISVYLQQHSAFFRRTPRLLDRLWDSPRAISAFAGRGVSNDPRLLGDLTISMLEGEHGVLSREFDKLIEWTGAEPLPDVINLPNSLLVALAAPLKRAFDRPVLCTLQGEELFLEGLQPRYRDRALALIQHEIPHVDRFVAVSHYCAEFMAGYLRIPRDRISVVPLGINMAGYRRRERPGVPFRIGYFARVAPEKGLHLLAQAYVALRRRCGDGTLRLEAAGYLAPHHRAYLAHVRELLQREGLGGEFAYRGELDREGKVSHLGSLDVLSVPATYSEPKGMFLLEAMAAGVPVVQPRQGAFVEIVESTGGGLLVARDDPEALAEGLYELWADPARRARLSQQAYDGVRAHYTVAQSATELLRAYQAVELAASGVPC
jgi:glycosyltransferase involved in cell wall biosynthesis